MDNKNQIILTGLVLLLLGGIMGYLIAGKNYNSVPYGMHMMPNGQLMSNNHTMSMQDMMNSMNYELKGKTGDEFDKSFLIEMIVHHEGAVEMAKLALQNAKHQEIKDLAGAIINAQNKEIKDMKGWLKSWYNQ